MYPLLRQWQAGLWLLSRGCGGSLGDVVAQWGMRWLIRGCGGSVRGCGGSVGYTRLQHGSSGFDTIVGILSPPYIRLSIGFPKLVFTVTFSHWISAGV
jgi:hypothetical protein